ncbi:hypothetical protein [Paenibacillus lemnae]|uniref:Uncharacterized protein n=1 Tax=Paenibacillus lemnae TaxID=1330551 RepID=A0A848M698_PAELE|nr:hypothetical protein [Paenibacillus lemnae]NMO95779.1 hypothetical protein [Paenibacillus lemnae]
MNRKQAWLISLVCLATWIAVIATAYTMIPDGSSEGSSLPTATTDPILRMVE